MIRYSLFWTLIATIGNLWAQGSEEFATRTYRTKDLPATVMLEDILVENFESVGKVGGAYIGAALLANRDFIHLDLKNPSVSVGDRFAVYGDLGALNIPGAFNRKVGKRLRLKGLVEVTKVTNGAVVGQIYDSSMSIEVGDILSPLAEVNFEIKPKEPTRRVRGKILSGARDFSLISPHDFAFINRGSQDGLQLNDRLFVYQTSEMDPRIDKSLPPVNIAELVVVHLGSKLSTVYCLGANDSFSAGASFQSAISEVRFLDDKSALDQSLNSENDDDSHDSGDSTEFEGAQTDMSVQFGPGLVTPIDRDGVHGPRFGFLIDISGKQWGGSFNYTIKSSTTHELSLAPQYFFRFQPFSSSKKLFLVAGAGPVASLAIDNGGTSASYLYRLGVHLNPQLHYYLTDQFYLGAAPISTDVYFWQYLSSTQVAESKLDATANFRTYVTLGIHF